MINEINMGDAPFFSLLHKAEEYLYFYRQWWPAGADVVIFWREGTGHCRRFCRATGELSEWDGVSGTTVYDGPLDRDVFTKLVEFAVKQGALEAVTQNYALSTVHARDRYMIKIASGNVNKFEVLGGFMENESHDRIKELFTDKLGLLSFYRQYHARLRLRAAKPKGAGREL